MALAAALRRRHVAMLAWYGLALGLNIQALLIAPFFLALLINRRVPIRLWPIAPLIIAATLLPAWAAGWPDLVTTYPPRADALSFNAPNIWAIVDILPLGGLPLLGLALASAIGASAGYVARFSAQSLSNKLTIPAALLATLLTAGLLPGMHERHFLLADILALILALVVRDRASVRIALLIQLGSVLAILGQVTDIDALTMFGAFAMITATVQLARPLLKPAANDNPLIARTA
jgi:Gpi18-like mannosyltransferase